MAQAIADASASTTGGAVAGATPSVASAPIKGGTVAAFSFSLKSSDYSQHFVGTAVLEHGRWELSWATACMLIEQSGVVCPNPPLGVDAPPQLPYSVSAEGALAASTPDILGVSSLAVGPHGDLLIADDRRDQIMALSPNGTMSVYAGTGEHGFTGDGGPASRAELDTPGAMVMSVSGTLYFVDGTRVRAVSPGGLISTVAGDGKPGAGPPAGPALQAPLNPDGLALSGTGTLYIATGSAIVKVAGNGNLVTLIKGGPPHGADIRTKHGAVAFFPMSMAFDKASNLDVFNSSPKELFQISPSGRLTDLGPFYATELALAPDGDVVAGGHGANIWDVSTNGRLHETYDLLTMKIAGYGVAGPPGGFQPDGLAVSPSGDIYLGTAYGNGWTSVTALAEVAPHGGAHVLAVRSPLTSTLPGQGAANFPTSLYPQAARSAGALRSCPSPSGLRPFTKAALAEAGKIAASFNTSFWGDLRSSDRSWWPGLFATWQGPGYDLGQHVVVSVGPAVRDTFSAIVSAACGKTLVRGSAVVVVGPSEYSSQVSHLYFLDRRGQPLVYFQAS
jgi:sugar lactone lactonase YvrE